MAEIKLKVIGAAGDTLAVSRAGERISLVHTAPYWSMMNPSYARDWSG